jgi:hypothetical protein
MPTRSYKGSIFEVWSSGESWFWTASDPWRKRCAIGAAATEAEAVAEACCTIDELVRPASAPLFTSVVAGWQACLARLELHLMRLGGAAA